jgi:aryl-alcohol dehydrogenase-like predicted oxidoreductase
MKYRTLGKTGFKISTISLGTWQVGGKWGSGFDHDLAQSILRSAIDQGVNFIDTADVYEGGESEKAVGKAVRDAGGRIYVATKCGRQINPHVSEGYTPKALRGYVEDSLQRLGLEQIDLIQLHCPPWEVYYRPEIFGLFDDLKAEGKIGHLGVSVEKVEQAIKALEYDNVASVQIIYNMFRQRPQDHFFEAAKARDVGIIVRVPLASGLLTGKFSKSSTFGEGDHRHGNRNGEWFDKGETFAGIPFERGLEAVDRVEGFLPEGYPLTHAALQWILRRQEVSTIIPGASRSEQVDSNLAAAEAASLGDSVLENIQGLYEADIKPLVHQLW